jgi:CRP/FNR family transcriptional regulator
MTPLPEILARTAMFAGLSGDELRRVAEIASPRRVERREAIFQEGDRADGFFVVATGRVKVFKLSGDGKEQVLHLIGPGQSFAEAAIFEGGAYPAGAEALSDALLLFIPKRPFIALLEKTPKMALRMLASLSKWLMRMTDLVESIALRDVETRLVRYIGEELTGRGGTIADGAVIDLDVSKNVLAARLGTVPETFSRTLRKLQDEGRIRVKGRQIRILKADSLRSLLGAENR